MRHDPFGPWATALSPVSSANLSTFWVRRLRMLPDLGKTVRGLSGRGRYGFIALATISLLMPSLSEKAGGDVPTHSQSKTEPAPKVESEQQALEEFLRTYRLAPGQDLKRVEPPRPAGVNLWWKQQYPNQMNRPDQFKAITLRWRDPDHLEIWGMGGYMVRSLPRFIEMGIYPPEIEGDTEILKTALTGDWVFRDGVPDSTWSAPSSRFFSARSGCGSR